MIATLDDYQVLVVSQAVDLRLQINCIQLITWMTMC